MLVTAITIVRQPVMVSFAITRQTERISATEAMFTASKNDKKSFELRISFRKGFRSATKTKEGRNTAKVEIIAPTIPLIW